MKVSQYASTRTMRKIKHISYSEILYTVLENDHNEIIIFKYFITGSDKVLLDVGIQFKGKLLDALKQIFCFVTRY